MFVTDIHTVSMTCYIDEYPLLCCTIIKFQSLVFRTCKFVISKVSFAPFKQKAIFLYTY